MAAYLGPPAPLAALLADPPCSLTVQAYRPRRQTEGSINVDGAGVAWWPAGEEAAPPLRYATALPPWSDPNLLPLAARLTGTVQLAAVRDATPGMPYGADATAPFTLDGVALAHNGRIGGFHGATGRELLARLPEELLATVGALTDSAVLFRTVLRHRRAGLRLAAALAAAALEVEKLCADLGVAATLTMLAAAADERPGAVTVAGVRLAHAAPAPTLFTLRAGGRWPGAALAASEPLDDDPGWTEVPDRHLVELGRDRTTLAPLDAKDPT
jgi:glutamine amidotransferase